MHSFDELNHNAQILQNCSAAQCTLIGSLDRLIKDEKMTEHKNTFLLLKKELLAAWSRNFNNYELIASLPLLVQIAKKQQREVTADCSSVSRYEGIGMYRFFMIENTVSRHRRIQCRRVDSSSNSNKEVLHEVPTSFSEYAALVGQFSIENESEYNAIFGMIQIQWNIPIQ